MEFIIGKYSTLLFIVTALLLALPPLTCFTNGVGILTGNDGAKRKTFLGIIFLTLSLVLLVASILLLVQYHVFISDFR